MKKLEEDQAAAQLLAVQEQEAAVQRRLVAEKDSRVAAVKLEAEFEAKKAAGVQAKMLVVQKPRRPGGR